MVGCDVVVCGVVGCGVVDCGVVGCGGCIGASSRVVLVYRLGVLEVVELAVVEVADVPV